jgi:translation initiation factor 4E
MVGESFTDKVDDVCGAVVNIRNKVDRLALWTRTAFDAEGNMKIGYVIIFHELLE